jgi:hypothetical protein
VWAAILTSLLATSERATADGITVVVPVNMTNLHEEVTDVHFALTFYFENDIKVAQGKTDLPVVDGSVQQDVEFTMSPFGAHSIFTATYYTMTLLLKHPDSPGMCVPNKIVPEGHGTMFVFCNDAPWSKMQTYAQMKGPISELVPDGMP